MRLRRLYWYLSAAGSLLSLFALNYFVTGNAPWLSFLGFMGFSPSPKQALAPSGLFVVLLVVGVIGSVGVLLVHNAAAPRNIVEGNEVPLPRSAADLPGKKGSNKQHAEGDLPCDNALTPAARIGQIIVAGNEKTPTGGILKKIPLYPGQVLTYPELQGTERGL